MAAAFPAAAEAVWHRGVVTLSPDENVPVARDPDSMPRWVPRAIAVFFGGAAAFFVARWLMSKLDGLLIILVVSLFLSFAIEPAVNWLAARGWRRGVATSLAFVVLFAITVGFVVSIATVFVRQLTRFVESAPGYLEDLETWVNARFGTEISTEELVQEITEAEGPLRDFATRLAGDAVGFSTTVVAGVFQIFTVVLFTWYLVADGPRLRRTILSVLPPDRQQHVLRAWELAIEKTGGYIYSRALLAVVSSAATWVALSVIGVPYPVALALWVGALSQFVPAIGTYIAGALPVVIALLNHPGDGLAVVVFLVVYQQVENYLLAPRITARTMQLHPAVAFGTVLAGAALFGPIGAVLALPSAAIIQAFGSTFIERHEVVESALTSPTPGRPARPFIRWPRRHPPAD